LLINCDGSCLDNGGTQAKATIGVFCECNHPMNFCGMYPQTNQIAELLAISKAVLIGGTLAREMGISTIIIASDSEYACFELTKWIGK
ncbi:hypothetical protein BGX38DRAFT_1110402, partial [Terfezia claveryi]